MRVGASALVRHWHTSRRSSFGDGKSTRPAEPCACTRDALSRIRTTRGASYAENRLALAAGPRHVPLNGLHMALCITYERKSIQVVSGSRSELRSETRPPRQDHRDKTTETLHLRHGVDTE